MPTSEPWNPNPYPSLIDADGNIFVECFCEGFDPFCQMCEGAAEYKEPAQPYRPDRKIRCTLGVQGTPIRWLAWDDKEIDAMTNLINDAEQALVLIRTWNHEEIEVVPAHIGYFQRNDAHGKF